MTATAAVANPILGKFLCRKSYQNLGHFQSVYHLAKLNTLKSKLSIVGFEKKYTRVTMLPILLQKTSFELKKIRSILNTSFYAAVYAPQFVNETKYIVKNTVVLRLLYA